MIRTLQKVFKNKRLEFSKEERAGIKVVSELYLESITKKIEKEGETPTDLWVKNVLQSVVTKVKERN